MGTNPNHMDRYCRNCISNSRNNIFSKFKQPYLPFSDMMTTRTNQVVSTATPTTSYVFPTQTHLLTTVFNSQVRLITQRPELNMLVTTPDFQQSAYLLTDYFNTTFLFQTLKKRRRKAVEDRKKGRLSLLLMGVSGGRGSVSPWIFMHGTDMIDRGLIMLLFDLFSFAPSPLEEA